MEVIAKRFIPIKTKFGKENNLKVEVFYDKGGYNYFTNKEDKRGYYVSVIPVERNVEQGYTTEITTAFRGYKYLLRAVSRKTKKTAELAIDDSKNIDWLINRICIEQGIELD